MELIDSYKETRECFFKGERYIVRDNGAISRMPLPGRKPRKLDNVWTFGKKNNGTGYMSISSHRVHIIVASAFHGEHDSKIYVVDHIDTNRCNNRPENLRWVTRLENVLLNPITLKKIKYLYNGNIQEFLENPSSIKDRCFDSPDLSWMRTVSSEDAKAAYERVMQWVSKPYTGQKSSGGSMEELMFRDIRNDKQLKFNNWVSAISSKQQEQNRMLSETEEEMPASSIYNKAVSPDTAVTVWRTPTEFPLCPNSISDQPLIDYLANIKKNSVFAKNIYGTSIVEDFALCDDRIVIVCHIVGNNLMKEYSTLFVDMHDNKFLHTGYTKFSREGAQYDLTIAKGEEWIGDLPFDCFC